MDYISRVGVFIEVVKHESFAGAARALGLTGPAISKQVQSLEDQLRFKILGTQYLIVLQAFGVVAFGVAS